MLSICAIVKLANVLHSDTYHPDRVSPGERLFMIHIRKLARSIMSSTVDKSIFRAHLVYTARMLLDVMDCSSDGVVMSAVPLEAVKSELDGCLGIGWNEGIEVDLHSFVRQFEVEYEVRKTGHRACK